MQDVSRQAPIRVIVTRPEPDAGRFAAMLIEAGFTPILSPVMELRFAERPPDLAGVGALAFSSANGVRALARLHIPAALPAFMVGAASADEARQRGFLVAGEAEGDVESLARLIEKAASRGAFSGAVLHAAGNDRAGNLVEALQRSKIEARLAVLYEAAPVSALSREAAAALSDDAPWVALFSPRAARLFVEAAGRAGLAEQLGSARALCLSDAVAEEAQKAGWSEIAVAPTRRAESMIETLRRRR
ncbi:MAG TPA: uroporphyrinogen-III synthase, partial [Parvularculaceae bacterium]|nr:uroporphyrinogen-III synthase [Parvularculaceae bacterium]